MSVNDLVMKVEDAAREVLFKTKALRTCIAHPGVTILVGDYDAEKHAYALATTILKSKDEMFIREDVMSAINDALGMAADNNQCPQCAHLMAQ